MGADAVDGERALLNGRRLVVLIGAVAALAFAGCRRSLQWQTFQDATAGFSADFPGKVTQPQSGKMVGPGGPAKYDFECRTSDGLTFHVTFTAQSHTPDDIAKAIDGLEKQKLASDSNYTSLSIGPVSNGTARGVEQVFRKQSKQYGDGFLRIRTFITPKGDYSLTVDSATSADANSPDVTRFFNSFKIDAAK